MQGDLKTGKFTLVPCANETVKISLTCSLECKFRDIVEIDSGEKRP